MSDLKELFANHEKWESKLADERQKRTDDRLDIIEAKVDSLRTWKAQVMAIRTSVIFMASGIGGIFGYALSAFKLWKTGT